MGAIPTLTATAIYPEGGWGPEIIGAEALSEFAATEEELREAVRLVHEEKLLQCIREGRVQVLNPVTLLPEKITGNVPKNLVVETQAFRYFARQSLGVIVKCADSNDEAIPDEKPFSKRERAQLLKILLGMAMAAYGYDPDTARNAAASKIPEGWDRVGLSATDDTVRKYLKEAAKLFPTLQSHNRKAKIG